MVLKVHSGLILRDGGTFFIFIIFNFIACLSKSLEMESSDPLCMVQRAGGHIFPEGSGG